MLISTELRWTVQQDIGAALLCGPLDRASGYSMFLAGQSTAPSWWAFAMFAMAMLAVALFARNREADYGRRLLANDWSARCLGMFVMAMGLGAAYLLAYSPISEAIAGGRTILVPRGAVGAPSVIVFVGLVLLIVGRHSHRWVSIGSGWDLPPLRWTIIAIGVTIGLASELGFEHYLQARGYTHFR